MSLQRKSDQTVRLVHDVKADDIAAIYNQAGDNYIQYADGDPRLLFAFDNLHSYADRRLWSVLDAMLVEHRSSGVDSIRLLDAGCGPGTWLRRLVTRAHALGFSHIEARGFDVAERQIRRARVLSGNLTSLPGVSLVYDVADLADSFPEADGSVDIAVCLYSVLSHLPVASLKNVVGEIARVTSGHFVTTVRPAGSTPTVFVDSIQKARRFRQDHERDRCEIEFQDGRRISANFHLFGATELRGYCEPYFDIEVLRGLDLFHGRFAPDSRWNPSRIEGEDRLAAELEALEERYAASPGFLERGAHLLFVGRRRRLPLPRSMAQVGIPVGPSGLS